MATSVPPATSPARIAVGLRPRLWQMAVAAAALSLGVAAAVQPALAVAAMLALVVLPVVLTRPLFGLSAVLLLGFLESVAGVTGALSLTKVIGALLVVSWLAIVAAAPPEERARDGLVARQPTLAAALVLFTIWAAISIAWAQAPGTAESAVGRFLLNFALFPIALVAIRRQRDVVWLFAVFIAGSLFSAALGLLTGSVVTPGETARLQGAGLNPNQLGTYLAVAIIFAAALFAYPRWPAVARWAALVAGFLAVAGLYLTVSREALLGLTASLLVAPFAIGRGRRAVTLAFVVLLAAGMTLWFAAFAPQATVQRLTNPNYGGAGGSGRTDLWKVGWRVVGDHPILGVGADNFGVVSVRYLLRPGADQQDKYVLKGDPPHNIYLNVLTELGAVGLALFAAIIAISLRSALLAARAFAARGDPAMELLARALLIALVGLVVADFFSSALYSKQLWFLLAVGPALLAVSRRSQASEPAVEARWSSPRGADLAASPRPRPIWVRLRRSGRGPSPGHAA